MVHFAKWTEQERFRYQKRVSEAKLENEAQSNEIIKLRQTSLHTALEQEIISNQLKNLYDSIQNLSEKKYVEDRFQNTIGELGHQLETL